MNKKAVAVIVAAGVLVLALGGFAIYRLSRPGGPLASDSKAGSGSSSGGRSGPGQSGAGQSGADAEPTINVPPPGPPGEPIYIPRDQLPPVAIPEGSPDNLVVKTTGGIRETQTSAGTVICSPQPSPEYWVEISDGKLGDRTFGMNWTIKNYRGPGEYEAVVGMAIRYPNGELAPFADGKAKVLVGPDGQSGAVKAEFQFKEGLVSVSMAYKCGVAGAK